MESVELKAKLVEYINKADNRLLRIVTAVFESYNDDETVATTVKGEPVSRKQYILNNEEALATFKEGDFESHEEIKKKFSH